MEREETIRRKSRARKKCVAFPRMYHPTMHGWRLTRRYSWSNQFEGLLSETNGDQQQAENSNMVRYPRTTITQRKHAPPWEMLLLSPSREIHTRTLTIRVTFILQIPLAALSGQQEIPTRLRGVRAHNLKNGPTCDEA